MKYEPMQNIDRAYIFLLIILFISGCTREIDKIVVPINNITQDLNRSTQKIDMPIDLFPDTGLKLKGSKLVIEKHF
jgi:hypothetical protein